MTRVEFKYGMESEVKIKEINVWGIIDGLMQTSCGKEYRVVYWDNAKRYSQWVYEYELEVGHK